MAQKLNSTFIRNYVQATQQIEMGIEADRQRNITKVQELRAVDHKPGASKNNGHDTIKDMDQHKVSWAILCERFTVDEKTIFTTGLNKDDAAQRNLKEGDNVLSEKVNDICTMSSLNQL